MTRKRRAVLPHLPCGREGSRRRSSHGYAPSSQNEAATSSLRGSSPPSEMGAAGFPKAHLSHRFCTSSTTPSLQMHYRPPTPPASSTSTTSSPSSGTRRLTASSPSRRSCSSTSLLGATPTRRTLSQTSRHTPSSPTAPSSPPSSLPSSSAVRRSPSPPPSPFSEQS
ncbi:hypothetical protein BCR35DRAFT_210650 [Leucosporidium creatinivorum]|uniref:Uncharacterized protein n=1 Tax=Leucosporidium creatinivorum TaxID=106004 RepID=A0A1Y2DDN2_9BASI|nr:hypothetical protein BCR35DRAFT_210650 [Leucosporidium creatinivorum]